MKQFSFLVLILSTAFTLQGCIAVLGAGAAAGTTAKVATDPRTTGTQVDDTTLNSRVNSVLKDHADTFIGARIIPVAYNGEILLTGQAQQSQGDEAARLIEGVDGVLKVYNQVRSGEPVGPGTITNDAWLTTKVKSQLIGETNTRARDIKVVTENGEVFLMGLVSREAGTVAADVASRVAGVSLVTTLFNYTD